MKSARSMMSSLETISSPTVAVISKTSCSSLISKRCRSNLLEQKREKAAPAYREFPPMAIENEPDSATCEFALETTQRRRASRPHDFGIRLTRSEPSSAWDTQHGRRHASIPRGQVGRPTNCWLTSDIRLRQSIRGEQFTTRNRRCKHLP